MNDIDLIAALRQSGSDRLDPRSRTRIRDRILTEFRRLPAADVERTMVRPSSRWFMPVPKPVLVTMTVVTLVIAIGISATAAATTAKPGDFLYPLGRGVEQLRLNLTVGSEAKVKYQAAVAEKRVQEFVELEKQSSPQAPAAKEESRRTIKKAIEKIEEVRAKQETEDNDRASETLERLENKLHEIEAEHLNQQENDQPSGLTQAEVKIYRSTTTVRIEFNGQKSVFTIDSKNEADIVAAIVQRTGVTAEQVRVVLKIEQVGDESREVNINAPNINISVNSSIRVNTNVRVNARGQRDDVPDDDDRWDGESDW